ncbi:hypothetical protein [Clostridium sp. VAP51]|uniref:hypothetical protein n=1 Tax=Clostridium sp. VAP51 TaxID=2949978 RepID=UPI00207ADF41|nr:hypothetical protein [Clostridium sp. VAP51]
MNRYIVLNKENIIISTRWGNGIVESEIQSDVGKIGQKMNKDGTFEDIPKEQIQENKEPTLEQQIEDLKKDNVVLMNSIASLYEEIAKLGGTV